MLRNSNQKYRSLWRRPDLLQINSILYSCVSSIYSHRGRMLVSYVVFYWLYNLSVFTAEWAFLIFGFLRVLFSKAKLFSRNLLFMIIYSQIIGPREWKPRILQNCDNFNTNKSKGNTKLWDLNFFPWNSFSRQPV